VTGEKGGRDMTCLCGGELEEHERIDDIGEAISWVCHHDGGCTCNQYINRDAVPGMAAALTDLLSDRPPCHGNPTFGYRCGNCSWCIAEQCLDAYEAQAPTPRFQS
jgi:hypothetical protein